jgi:putative restriction endonuclease
MATPQGVMWEAMRAHLPRDRWISLDDIYNAVRHHVTLSPEDLQPAARGNSQERWQRNVRNILQHRKKTFELLWAGDARYMLPSAQLGPGIAAEFARRMQTWEALQTAGKPITSSSVRDAEIYAGQAGIYTDRTRTASLTGGASAVAVGLLHTGTSYPDDLGEDGLVYHYPLTRRPGATDQNEIEATKWAGRLGLPVFVITIPEPGVSRREVRLGWVTKWSDEARIFLVSFHDSPPSGTLPPSSEESSEEPFQLHEDAEPSFRLAKTRPGQADFKFEVMARYGTHCAVCPIAIPEAIEAAHLLPKSKKGTDDPRNGLALCATHHRAFDAGLFAFHPTTLAICLRTRGPSAEALGLTRASLVHLRNPPHPEAIHWRWTRFNAVHGTLAPAKRRS